jgi:hypothetical protein
MSNNRLSQKLKLLGYGHINGFILVFLTMVLSLWFKEKEVLVIHDSF